MKETMEESIKAKKEFLNQSSKIKEVISRLIECFEKGNKLLICGNGGSAADAQHIAAELVGRFKKTRKGLPAISLSTDTSILTAWSNDYEFETVFERQVEALGKKGDALLAISTSGNSKNILKAVEKAKEQGMTTISLTGKDGGKLKQLTDLNINSSADSTARIQECHLLAYHIICEEIENHYLQ
ncbi:D-sedoheptulose 7-phosphate isomerase [Candidatus Woesearchaeota archaeon]|nr:D-sedoheptulose 7-phosphate isomerase [Candidatus Woesearchaeota archaeon]